MVNLVVFGGYPGVGKSTLSYRLASDSGWALLSKDVIFSALDGSGSGRDRAGFGSYEALLALTKLNLQNSVSVIIEGGFQFERLRQSALEIAAITNAQAFGVECICSDETLWKQRLENRPQIVEGFVTGGWGEVERIRGVYEPWSTPRLVLDATESLDVNYRRLLAYLGVNKRT